MKRALVYGLLLVPTLAFAEQGKSIRFSRGEMIVFALIAFGIVAIALLIVSAILFSMLSLTASGRKYWPTLLGSFLGFIPGVILASYMDEWYFLPPLVGAIVGALLGFYLQKPLQ